MKKIAIFIILLLIFIPIASADPFTDWFRGLFGITGKVTSEKPIILNRTVRDCATGNSIGAEQIIDLRTFRDGTYTSYTCASRYSQQCIDDGSFDNYYDETCEYETVSTIAPPYCGDNLCNGAESCSTCSGDCGNCPIATPTCTPSCNTCSGFSDVCDTTGTQSCTGTDCSTYTQLCTRSTDGIICSGGKCQSGQCVTQTQTIPSINPSINGVCGGTKDPCTSGIFLDILDNSTDYLWSCTGQNGGITRACNLQINTPAITICTAPSGTACDRYRTAMGSNVPDVTEAFKCKKDGDYYYPSGSGDYQCTCNKYKCVTAVKKCSNINNDCYEIFPGQSYPCDDIGEYGQNKGYNCTCYKMEDNTDNCGIDIKKITIASSLQTSQQKIPCIAPYGTVCDRYRINWPKTGTEAFKCKKDGDYYYPSGSGDYQCTCDIYQCVSAVKKCTLNNECYDQFPGQSYPCDGKGAWTESGGYTCTCNNDCRSTPTLQTSSQASTAQQIVAVAPVTAQTASTRRAAYKCYDWENGEIDCSDDKAKVLICKYFANYNNYYWDVKENCAYLGKTCAKSNLGVSCVSVGATTVVESSTSLAGTSIEQTGETTTEKTKAVSSTESSAGLAGDDHVPDNVKNRGIGMPFTDTRVVVQRQPVTINFNKIVSGDFSEKLGFGDPGSSIGFTGPVKIYTYNENNLRSDINTYEFNMAAADILYTKAAQQGNSLSFTDWQKLGEINQRLDILGNNIRNDYGLQPPEKQTGLPDVQKELTQATKNLISKQGSEWCSSCNKYQTYDNNEKCRECVDAILDAKHIYK